MTVSTRVKLIVALVVVIAVIGVLIQTAVTKASTYYITVGELYKSTNLANQETAVSGNLVGSSVDWSAESRTLKFSLQDPKGSKPLPVVFHGDKPDNFGNNWPVIVFGKLNDQGTFVANKLLIKCPSKYSSEDKTYNAAS